VINVGPLGPVGPDGRSLPDHPATRHLYAGWAGAAAEIRARWDDTPPLIPPARTRAGLYAAARARYLATGRAADLAEMERHVTLTPQDGGPEWEPDHG
jgi:hypothetical protein